jgi:hypothetical protein
MFFKRVRQPLLLILLACLCLCGCGKNDSEKLNQESKKVLSWVASAEMICEAWSSGSVPDAYARRSLLNIYKELGQNTLHLQSISDNRRPQIISNIERNQSLVSQLASAVEQGDRTRSNQLHSQLANSKTALASIVNAAPQTP